MPLCILKSCQVLSVTYIEYDFTPKSRVIGLDLLAIQQFIEHIDYYCEILLLDYLSVWYLFGIA